ncbi:hypothetical protein THAOC_29677, partial [Thalassiosira oceanica]
MRRGRAMTMFQAPGAAAAACGRRVAQGPRESGDCADVGRRAGNHPTASADRFRRTDRAAQQSECDFSDKQSVNRCYPTHRGKGRHDVPQSLIDRCHSVAAKARAVREWRVLTSEQQKQRKESLAAKQRRRARS